MEAIGAAIGIEVFVKPAILGAAKIAELAMEYKLRQQELKERLRKDLRKELREDLKNAEAEVEEEIIKMYNDLAKLVDIAFLKNLGKEQKKKKDKETKLNIRDALQRLIPKFDNNINKLKDKKKGKLKICDQLDIVNKLREYEDVRYELLQKDIRGWWCKGKGHQLNNEFNHSIHNTIDKFVDVIDELDKFSEDFKYFNLHEAMSIYRQAYGACNSIKKRAKEAVERGDLGKNSVERIEVMEQDTAKLCHQLENLIIMSKDMYVRKAIEAYMNGENKILQLGEYLQDEYDEIWAKKTVEYVRSRTTWMGTKVNNALELYVVKQKIIADKLFSELKDQHAAEMFKLKCIENEPRQDVKPPKV